jgi:hypothetical protein
MVICTCHLPVPAMSYLVSIICFGTCPESTCPGDLPVSAYSWVSWKEHVDTLLDPTRAAAMGPNAFAPFGVPALLGQLVSKPAVPIEWSSLLAAPACCTRHTICNLMLTPIYLQPSTSPARDFVFTADNLPALYLMRLLLTNRYGVQVIPFLAHLLVHGINY